MTFMDNSGSGDKEGPSAPFVPFALSVPFELMMFSVLLVKRDLAGLVTRFKGRLIYRMSGEDDVIEFWRLKWRWSRTNV